LAHAYADGKGLPTNLKKSIKWILLAMRTGSYSWIEERIQKRLKHYNEARQLFLEIRKIAEAEAEIWAKNHPDAFFIPPED